MGSANAETTPAEHRPQRPTERSAPTQHAEGRTGDCPGPRKETATGRTVTRGGGALASPVVCWGRLGGGGQMGGLMQNCRRQGPSCRCGHRAGGCTARGPARHTPCPRRPVPPRPQAQARHGVHTEPAGRDEARHRDAGPAVCWRRGGPEEEHEQEPDEVLRRRALLREASASSLRLPCASERLCACGCSFTARPM